MGLFQGQVDSSPMSLFNIEAFATEEAMVSRLMALVNTTEMNSCYRNGAGMEGWIGGFVAWKCMQDE